MYVELFTSSYDWGDAAYQRRGMDLACSEHCFNPHLKTEIYSRLYLVDRLLMFLKSLGYAMPRYVKTYYLDKGMMRKG